MARLWPKLLIYSSPFKGTILLIYPSESGTFLTRLVRSFLYIVRLNRNAGTQKDGSMKTIKWSVSITLMLSLVASVVKGFTIDGVLDAQYGSAIVTQQLNTSTSDNTEGLIDRANGTELDAAYGTISNGVLYLFLAGNLDSDDVADNITYDKLQIFFMTGPGGDHTLGTNYNGSVDFGHFNRPNGVTRGSSFILKTGPIISLYASSSARNISALVTIDRNLYI